MTAPSAAVKKTAKKAAAPAKRTAVKKAPPAKTRPSETALPVDETPGGLDGSSKPKLPTITWRGRTMRVQAIGFAQAGVWERTRSQLLAAASNPKAVDPERAVKLSGRAVGLVRSILVDDDDKEWVEAEILDDVSIDVEKAVAQIVTPAIDAVLAAQGGQATAPRTGPVKAARLRR